MSTFNIPLEKATRLTFIFLIENGLNYFLCFYDI